LWSGQTVHFPFAVYWAITSALFEKEFPGKERKKDF
jgi:hypothetical protein